MAYIFDWHWRAEIALSGRSRCSTLPWKPSLKQLHDTMSRETLHILPLPFLVVCGHCAKGHYQKTLGKDAKILKLAIAPGGNLEFALDFQHLGLKRIAIFVRHPAPPQYGASFLFKAELDAGFNFFLWLFGREHEEASFPGKTY